MACSQHVFAREPVDDGAADVTDPCAVHFEHITRLIATDEVNKYADVEVLFGCFQLIGDIEKQTSAEEGHGGEP